MYILSKENIFDENGDCLYDDLIILSWRNFSDDAKAQFSEQLDKLQIDLIEYDFGNSDFYFRLVLQKDFLLLKIP